MHKEARGAHVTGDTEFLHDVELRGSFGGACGNDGAAEIAQGFFEHQPGWRELVVEGILHNVTGAEADGIKGLCVSPVVLGPVLGIKDGAGGQENTLQIPDILRQQAAQAGTHGLQEDELFLLENRNVLDIGKGLEFFDVELSTIKTFFNIFRITVGVREQFFQLNEVILLALIGIKNFTAAEDTLSAILASHPKAPV